MNPDAITLAITFTPEVPGVEMLPAQIYVYNDEDLDHAFELMAEHHAAVLANGDYEITRAEIIH